MGEGAWCCSTQGRWIQVAPCGRGCARGVRTALDLQRAVLLVQRVPPQVHHAGGRGGDPERGREKKT